MVHKTLNNRYKKSATLMGLVMTIIVFIGIFTIMFSWLTINSEQSEVAIDSRHNESYNRVIEQREELNSTVLNIQDKLNKVEESPTIAFVAWNGMKFLIATVLAFADLVLVSIGSFEAVSDVLSASGIPPSILILITVGITAFVVFLVIAALKGEPKVVK